MYKNLIPKALKYSPLLLILFPIASFFYTNQLEETLIPEYHSEVRIYAIITTLISALLFIGYIPYKIDKDPNTPLQNIVLGIPILVVIYWCNILSIISAGLFIAYILYRINKDPNMSFQNIAFGITILVGIYGFASLFLIVTNKNVEGYLFKKLSYSKYNKNIYIFEKYRPATSQNVLLIVELKKSSSTDFSIYAHNIGESRMSLITTLPGVNITNLELQQEKYLMISLDLLENDVQESVLGINTGTHSTGFNKNYFCVDIEKGRECRD